MHKTPLLICKICSYNWYIALAKYAVKRKYLVSECYMYLKKYIKRHFLFAKYAAKIDTFPWQNTQLKGNIRFNGIFLEVPQNNENWWFWKVIALTFWPICWLISILAAYFSSLWKWEFIILAAYFWTFQKTTKIDDFRKSLHAHFDQFVK